MQPDPLLSNDRLSRTSLVAIAVSLALIAGGVLGIVALSDDGGDESTARVAQTETSQTQPDTTEPVDTTESVPTGVGLETADVTQIAALPRVELGATVVPWRDTFLSVRYTDGDPVLPESFADVPEFAAVAPPEFLAALDEIGPTTYEEVLDLIELAGLTDVFFQAMTDDDAFRRAVNGDSGPAGLSAMILGKDGAWTDTAISTPDIAITAPVLYGSPVPSTSAGSEQLAISSDGEHLVVIVDHDPDVDSTAGNPTVSITSDLETWETQSLPRPSGPDSPYLDETMQLLDVAVGPVGWSAVYAQSIRPNTDKLVADYIDPLASSGSIGTSDDGITFSFAPAQQSAEALSEPPRPTITAIPDGDKTYVEELPVPTAVPDPDSGPSLDDFWPTEVFVNWDELPIDHADIGGGLFSVGARYGEAPSLGDATVSLETVATDHGFLRLNRPHPSVPPQSNDILQFSTDGVNYTPLAGPAGMDDHDILTIGSLGDATLVITEGAVFVADAAGEGWREVPLPDAVALSAFTEDPYLGATIVASDARAIGDWSNDEGVPFTTEVEKDGYRIVSYIDRVELYEVESGDLVATYSGSDPNRVRNPTALRTDLFDPETGELLVTLMQDEWPALPGQKVQYESVDGRLGVVSTWQLIATTDASTWYVQDVDGYGGYGTVVNGSSVLMPRVAGIGQPPSYSLFTLE